VNEQAVRRLTCKGCIVAKEAAEGLKHSDVERIEALDSIPMYLSVAMLENLRAQNHELLQVEFVSDCPDFMGIDLEGYGPFEEGDTAELPGDNAEILINRGIAEPTR